MGIKHLNSMLKKTCPRAIKTISLYNLKKKTVVVDASIYMYRFASQGTLIEGIYQMACLLQYYGIIPIFVFDGKPPAEKKELLETRKKNKEIAYQKYEELKSLENKTPCYNKLQQLKRQFVTVSCKDVNKVKYLLGICGITCIQANGEADELCAKMVIDNHAWGCVSDDMDMFVLGCPRVFRYFNTFNDTLVLYDTELILKQLGTTMDDFKTLCVIGGTDYSSSNTSLYNGLKLFNKYKNMDTRENFKTWLIKNSNYINNIDNFNNLLNIFEIKNIDLSEFDITCGNVNEEMLKKFLSEYNFIFI
tara:strand:+ start:21186 stop:22100 length:915 start_codon:yes stop_codon:yes gene_type:complete